MSKAKTRRVIVEANGVQDEGQQTLTSWLPKKLDEMMKFETAEPMEVQVFIGDEELVLREADEGATSIYKDAQLRAIKFSNEEGKVKITGTDGTAETRALLVSRCLFRVCKDKPTEMERVPLEEIQGWVPSVVRALFDRIKLISQIDEATDTEESLQTRISELQGKLEQLRSNGERPKNSPADTSPSSA